MSAARSHREVDRVRPLRNLGNRCPGSGEGRANRRRILRSKTHDLLGQVRILNAVEFDPDRRLPPVDPRAYVLSTDLSAL